MAVVLVLLAHQICAYPVSSKKQVTDLQRTLASLLVRAQLSEQAKQQGAQARGRGEEASLAGYQCPPWLSRIGIILCKEEARAQEPSSDELDKVLSQGLDDEYWSDERGEVKNEALSQDLDDEYWSDEHGEAKNKALSQGLDDEYWRGKVLSQGLDDEYWSGERGEAKKKISVKEAITWINL